MATPCNHHGKELHGHIILLFSVPDIKMEKWIIALLKDVKPGKHSRISAKHFETGEKMLGI